MPTIVNGYLRKKKKTLNNKKKRNPKHLFYGCGRRDLKKMKPSGTEKKEFGGVGSVRGRRWVEGGRVQTWFNPEKDES